MADDIFNLTSKAELKRRIDSYVQLDERSLPPRAKVFGAVASIQGYDQYPALVSPPDIEQLIEAGGIELQRGIAMNYGKSAVHYARELFRGPLYPGYLSGIGHGIYMATAEENNEGHHAFPRVSHIARLYAWGPGVIVRGVLKVGSKTCDVSDLHQHMREQRNRRRDVGITDLGTFAASLGLDGYYCENLYDGTKEKVWIVLNRTAVVFQNTVLQVGAEPVV